MKNLLLKTSALDIQRTAGIFDQAQTNLVPETKRCIRTVVSSGAGGVGKSAISFLKARLLAEALAPSNENVLLIDYDTSEGNGIHDLIQPIYTTRERMPTPKDFVDQIFENNKPLKLWDPLNPKGSVIQPIKYRSNTQKESNLLYMAMSPEERDAFLYDAQAPLQPVRPEKGKGSAYDKKIKIYEKDMEGHDKKTRAYHEFHAQLAALKNQFEKYRIRFMIFDLSPGPNLSISPFFKSADFIFLVLDMEKAGKSQYEKFISRLMRKASHLEYDMKATVSGERMTIPRINVMLNKARDFNKPGALKTEINRIARAELIEAVKLKLNNKTAVDLDDLSELQLKELLSSNQKLNMDLYRLYNEASDRVAAFEFRSHVLIQEEDFDRKLKDFPLALSKYNSEVLQEMRDFLLYYKDWTSFNGERAAQNSQYKEFIGKWAARFKKGVIKAAGGMDL